MLECGLRAVVLHNKEVVWNYYAEFTADCRRINTNQQKRLLSEVFIINASTTVGEVSAAVSKGTILIYHTTATKMPSYGKGIILYSSDENFKALLADDDNHSVYLWSCHKQRPSTKILDVVNVIKIV